MFRFVGDAAGEYHAGEVSNPIHIGDLVAGKYRVDRVLGEGGMGVVVAATHEQLEQRVALKYLLPALVSNVEVVRRFLREARAAVKIQSEHVARVLDVGATESGTPYMVMEYLDGEDLSQVLAARGPLPAEETVGFLLEACEAIAEAHSLGIVHRDLKPANLFLARRPSGRSIVKVLDFGISKVPTGGKDAATTSTTALMGSPVYMSPEQMAAPEKVDVRTDVWCLGVVLYELLTQQLPFEGETMPELVFTVVQKTHLPLRPLRPDLPEGLAAVVDRCLEKGQAQRFASVAELARALAPFAPPRSAQSIERIEHLLGLTDASPPPYAGPRAPFVSRPDGQTFLPTTSQQTAPKSRLFLVPVVLVAMAAVVGSESSRFDLRSASRRSPRLPHPPRRRSPRRRRRPSRPPSRRSSSPRRPPPEPPRPSRPRRRRPRPGGPARRPTRMRMRPRDPQRPRRRATSSASSTPTATSTSSRSALEPTALARTRVLARTSLLAGFGGRRRLHRGERGRPRAPSARQAARGAQTARGVRGYRVSRRGEDRVLAPHREEVNALPPTLILAAQDGSGNDLYDVKVSRDGASLATALDGRPLRVDPGEHVFVFEQAGQAPVEKRLVLREGDRDRHEGVVIGPPPPPVLPSTPPPPQPTWWTTQRVLAVIGGGLGLVGVGLGTSWGLYAISSQNQEKSNCSASSCNHQKQAVVDYNSARDNATASDVSFGVGAAFLAAGAVLWLTAPSVAVTPAVGSHGGGLSLGGSF